MDSESTLMWAGRIPLLYSFNQDEVVGYAVCERDGDSAKITITLPVNRAKRIGEVLEGSTGMFLAFGHTPAVRKEE